MRPARRLGSLDDRPWRQAKGAFWCEVFRNLGDGWWATCSKNVPGMSVRTMVPLPAPRKTLPGASPMPPTECCMAHGARSYAVDGICPLGVSPSNLPHKLYFPHLMAETGYM